MANDDGVVGDDSEGDGERDNVLWIAPIITKPLAGTTVSQGFDIDAIVTVPPGSKWNIDIYINSTKLKRYSGTPTAATLIFQTVEPGLIPPGARFYFKVEYKKFLGWSDWAWSGDLTMAGSSKPPPPSVSNPAIVWIPRPTLSGRGVAGASVQLFEGGVGTIIFATTQVLSDGTWSVQLKEPLWMANPFNMTARQTLNGETSDWAVNVQFIVLFKPVISTVSVDAGGKPTISGYGGLRNARIEIWLSGGAGGAQLVGTVRQDGSWSMTATSAWAPNSYLITARQVAGGHESDWAVGKTFEVKPLVPAITEPAPKTSHLANVLVKGTRMAGATVVVQDTGSRPIVGTLSYSGNTWSFAYPWLPGAKHVKAVQTVNGQTSAATGVLEFTIKPPKPVIQSPPVPAAAKELLTITGVVSGAHLEMFTEAGVRIDGSFKTEGATSTFTHPGSWLLGTTRVKVTQTVNNVRSDDSALVAVSVKPPAPRITLPEEKERYNTLEVQGTCEAGATVNVWSGGTHLGPTEVVGTNWKNRFDWQPGPKVVHAIQTVREMQSDHSVVINFIVKPPPPTVVQPPNPTAAQQVLTITDVWANASLLQMYSEAGATIAGDFSPTGTTRTFTAKEDWAAGITKVQARQVVNNVGSDLSELVTLAVKPQAPQISLPKEGESYVALQVQGTCEPGATVTVWSGGTDLGPVQVTGTSWTNDFTWQPGPKVVQARQAVAGQDSPDTGVINFKIKPPKPMISPPPDPAAADEALMITGVWEGSVNLAMFTEANHPVAGDFSDGGTSRTFTPLDDWAPGINTVKVVQTVNTVASDPSDECTFSVEVGEKPEAPQFLLPMPGARTSTRPTIKVRGLAGALHTVRLEEGATLHEYNADVDGILEFTVETPLTPGTNVLQVRQKAGGPVSEWSGPHRFTVKELPQKPIIEAPGEGHNASRTPTIRGTGETRGEIMLRHADSEKLIDTITGVKPWRWTAREPWPIGDYSVEVQQTDEGDSSGWSDARTFKVVESLYGIGDSTPVLANPVVGSGQSVKLRVQVLSGNSGEAAEGVAVQWRLNGQEDILDTTVTDSDGWAYYAYTPETVGKSEVVADITNDNDGVVMTQLYEVNARLHDDWAQQAQLTLGGQNVKLDLHDLVLAAGKTLLLTLTFKDGNHLWGTYVTLQDMWGTAEGLTVVPPLGTPQKVEAPMLTWFISSAEGQSGIFGLRLTSPVLSDWQLPGRVITEDFVHTLDVELDTFPQVFGGEAVYPCLGARHTLTVRPKPDSPIIGLPVLPEFTPEAVDLGVTLRPLVQTMKESGVSWSLDCFTSSKSGNFAMRLALLGWFLKSGEMPMSLGHNKVEITERDGPSQIDGRWRYGIRVTSAFSGQPAGDVAVTVSVSGSEDVQRNTQSDGWIYVYYDDGQVVSFTIHNGYDGTTVTG
ncbi:hypothetical protein HUW52_12950 [Pseudomonas sp. 43A]|uniref:hypothetical protein n=1 Tax=unclassified Pseudomonas TaxID=196821 RepID=UPI001587B7D9|nr:MULTISPECIES: hypothetical protein [unclassified Pseudomonas]QKV63750.1 hypothetical protein HUW52_12950 [Pseudomonas sp. 43A]QMW08110.1 hypothetical protein H3303_19750 [Pseudomonas sp. 29A]